MLPPHVPFASSKISYLVDNDGNIRQPQLKVTVYGVNLSTWKKNLDNSESAGVNAHF